MSALKEKVHQIRPSMLEWVLRTAMPLRPDFEVWLDGKRLEPSKQGRGILERWVLGKDLVKLPKPAPKGITVSKDTTRAAGNENRFGLEVPGLGRISGYAEAYKDLLTGKSDEIGRSYGFFVYVYGRLINVADGHFGISPNELRHGTFGRFRLVINMDGLDDELRSNRESVSEGTLLAIAQNVLRAIFNAIRPALEQHDLDETPGAKLSRKLAASPASLSRRPIVDLVRAVLDGKATARYLIVPPFASPEDQELFIDSLEQRAAKPEEFLRGVQIDYDGSPEGGIAQYDTATGLLRINAWHPFVATFHDDFASKASGQPLELLAMAEVLAEAQLHTVGVRRDYIDEFLGARDQLLRSLANESGRRSAFAVAKALHDARNDPDALEDALCAAFGSLGFAVTPIGGSGKPDGVATALLAASTAGVPQQYAVSLEAKSKVEDRGSIAAGTVKVSAVVRQRDDFRCHHAIVVGRSFATSKGAESALSKEIEGDRRKSTALGEPKTITLITIDALAKLVRLRPVKHLGLKKLRDLFTSCVLPEQSANWVEAIDKSVVTKPPYKRIVLAIEAQQKQFTKNSVKYAALRVALANQTPTIKYETDDDLMEICKAMAQMAPGAMFAGPEKVELDQSATNVIDAINEATREYEEGP